MQETDNLNQSTTQEYDKKCKAELFLLIRTSSLKKQVAIKIAKLVTAGLINQDKLKTLPTELIAYIKVHEQIESLDPENPLNFHLPKGLKPNFCFLKSIYLIEDDSYLFHNLSLLIEGLRKIALKQKYSPQATTPVIPEDNPIIDPIFIVSQIILHTMELFIEETTSLDGMLIVGEFQKLVQYCATFNNIALLTFLNLAHPIQLNATRLEQTPIGSSMIDLAFMSSENNKPIIKFLKKEAKRRGEEWKTLISERALLRGILSSHKEKRMFLVHLATKYLNINSNQYIGFPVETCKPVQLALLWGYEDVFEFLLKQFKPLSGDSVNHLYKNILKQFSSILTTSAQQQEATFIVSNLNMLEMFQGFLDKQNPKFAERKKDVFNEIRIKLTSTLKELS